MPLGPRAGCKQIRSAAANSLKAANNATSHPLGTPATATPASWNSGQEGERRAPVPIIVALHHLQNTPGDWAQRGNGFIDSCAFQMPLRPWQLGTAQMHRLQRLQDQKANIKTLRIVDDISYFKSMSWFCCCGRTWESPGQELKCPGLTIRLRHIPPKAGQLVGLQSFPQCHPDPSAMQTVADSHSHGGCVQPCGCWIQHGALQNSRQISPLSLAADTWSHRPGLWKFAFCSFLWYELPVHSQLS